MINSLKTTKEVDNSVKVLAELLDIYIERVEDLKECGEKGNHISNHEKVVEANLDFLEHLGNHELVQVVGGCEYVKKRVAEVKKSVPVKTLSKKFEILRFLLIFDCREGEVAEPG